MLFTLYSAYSHLTMNRTVDRIRMRSDANSLHCAFYRKVYVIFYQAAYMYKLALLVTSSHIRF